MENKQKILIIDDNSDNIKVAANILKNKNRIIWVATSGKNGIEIAKLKKPDLILLDIQMPEMDGIEVCKRLKEDIFTNEIPVVFMTARNDDEVIKEAFEAGGVDYITKPIKNEELLARVKTQLRLVDSINRLKETINTKNKFFSIIAHDLIGPLGGLSSLFRMVYEEYDDFDFEEIKAVLYGATESSERIYNLLQNLLEWSKTQTNMIKYKPDKLNLSEIIEDILEKNKSVLNTKQIVLENKFLEKYEIFADRVMIQSIITNLLSNAIKFSEFNGYIEIGFNESEEYREIYVKDNGIGMNQETRNNLFKIEEKIVSVGTYGEKGNGLGLLLCNEFIKLHNGEILVESDLGKGSIFTIKIPIKGA